MPSKRLASGLFAVACIVSAAGGAYFALRQDARPAVTPASPSVDGSPAAQPQPVASVSAATTTKLLSTPPVVKTEKPTEPDTTSARAAVRGRPVQAPPAESVARRVMPRPQSQVALATERPSSDRTFVPEAQTRPDESTSQPPSVTTPPITSPQGVDPGPQAQRPWPGPPMSQAPSQQSPQASGAVAEPVSIEQESPADQRSRQWLEVLVPSESVIGLQLESTINTEFARIEDQVDARVTRDVRVGGHVVIPAGTRAIGSVTLVERGGPVKTRARIGFRFHTLVFADRSRVPISTDAVYRVGESPGNQSSARIGSAAIGGAIIGAILGGGKGAAIGSGIGAAGGAAAAMHGDRFPVVVPAGTTLSVRTQAPVSLPIEK
jgi:hypothetical protein